MDTPAQPKYKVLLIGDNCTDHYVFGTCNRISREAPIPVFEPSHTTSKPGMGTNVKENLEAFNIDVTFFTYNDPVINTRYIDTRYGTQVFRTQEERKRAPAHYPNIEGYDAIVISDYETGFITYGVIEDIQKGFDGPIYIDTKKNDFARFDRCFIKVNEDEYNNRASDGKNMIVSLGGKGAMYNDEVFPARKVDVSDVCGAGDTFLAALVYNHLKTCDIKEAIVYANLAAAVSVQHLGCYALNQSDIAKVETDATWMMLFGTTR